MVLFSRKVAPKPDTYQYTFPQKVRSRILLAFKHVSGNALQSSSFGNLLDDVNDTLMREYGGLVRADKPTGVRSVIEHFARCSDVQVIDFILVAFRSWYYRGEQRGVDEINRILREESIGYEFTDFVSRHVEKPDNETPRRRGRIANFIEYDYPEVIVKNDEYAHAAIVKPSLVVLGKPAFKVANREMLSAHEHIRTGKLDDAVTCCAAAYESVMRTILDKKKWTYSPSDSCAALVEVCIREGLLPGFYAEALKAPGRIRNKLSSSHGRGPAPAHAVDSAAVDHMIQVTSANILLLVSRAKM